MCWGCCGLLLVAYLQLLPAGKYCEFARLFGEEKFSQAGGLLVELLEAGVVPKRYQP